MTSFCLCLWFDGKALPAAEFYKSVFKNVQIEQIEKYVKAGQEIHGQPEGSVMTVVFSIGKQKFLGLNGGPEFKFNPSMSNFLFCSSLEEIEAVWQALVKEGLTRMPLGTYPWSPKYGWVVDKFGVEWQIMFSEDRNEVVPGFLFVDKLFGQGQKALDFYTKHFKPSEVVAKTMNEKTNSVMFAEFHLGSQKFILMEGEGQHGHVFNEAYSIMIECDSQDEIDFHWQELSAGGSEGPCGWLKDSFGVSWQVVPKELSVWMKNATTTQLENFMTAMMSMKKLNLDLLKKAITT